MGFTESVKTCLRKYFDFRGRARRSEFWWFYLFTLVGMNLLAIVDAILFPGSSTPGSVTFGLNVKLIEFDPMNIMQSPLSNSFGHLVLIPTISAAVRRLHDIAKTGWYILLPLAPVLVSTIFASIFGMEMGNTALTAYVFLMFALLFILTIVIVIMLAHDAGPGENWFGPSPKYDDVAKNFD